MNESLVDEISDYFIDKLNLIDPHIYFSSQLVDKTLNMNQLKMIQQRCSVSDIIESGLKNDNDPSSDKYIKRQERKKENIRKEFELDICDGFEQGKSYQKILRERLMNKVNESNKKKVISSASKKKITNDDMNKSVKKQSKITNDDMKQKDSRDKVMKENKMKTKTIRSKMKNINDRDYIKKSHHYNKQDKNQTDYSSFDFNEDEHNSIYNNKQGNRSKKVLLKKALEREERIRQLKQKNDTKSLKRNILQHQWNAAKKRSQGLKVKDNPKLLEKSIQRKILSKRKNIREWKRRESSIKEDQRKRQLLRMRNLAIRSSQRKRRKLDHITDEYKKKGIGFTIKFTKTKRINNNK